MFVHIISLWMEQVEVNSFKREISYTTCTYCLQIIFCHNIGMTDIYQCKLGAELQSFIHSNLKPVKKIEVEFCLSFVKDTIPNIHRNKVCYINSPIN